jgi:DNA gyrase/topoisomerase IV subunit B
VEAHAKEEQACGVNLDGGRAVGMDLDGGGGRHGVGMEVVCAMSRWTRKRSDWRGTDVEAVSEAHVEEER